VVPEGIPLLAMVRDLTTRSKVLPDAPAFAHFPFVYRRQRTCGFGSFKSSSDSIALCARRCHEVGRNRRYAQVPYATLHNGDTIAVVGATGGVGRIVVSQIIADGQFRVRALVRSLATARDCFPNAEGSTLDIAVVDILAGPQDAQLVAALIGVKAVVITTGTTAFPTRAWGPWFQNTPYNVDRGGTKNILSCLDVSTTQRVILLTSIGTMRSRQFPFVILNLFGVLDAKRAGELSVMASARRDGYNYAIVRAGRLVGVRDGKGEGLDANSGATGVELAQGDLLAGDVSRANVATAVRYILDWNKDLDVDFCVINSASDARSRDWWHRALEEL
jgi:NAD(P)H-binding